jgi:ATP-dependent Clp protease ATP-binding subunit ClpA
VNGGKVTVDHDLENDQVSLTFDEGSSGQESESGTEVAVD